MTSYSISQLARLFGLSRSTLLYYDRIGLLCPAARTPSGYRRYSSDSHDRLEKICMFRGTGLPLSDIKALLDGDNVPTATILEDRLRALETEIAGLRNQQHLTLAMLKEMTRTSDTPVVDKAMWVTMLEAAGMDEAAMAVWHAEFERRAPEAHHAFLLSLGIPGDEAQTIRAWARGVP